jgi:hypothetical protein
MKRFTIDEQKFNRVVRIVHDAQYEDCAIDVEETIDADWDAGTFHQEWLDTATAEEIADWVITILKNNM